MYSSYKLNKQGDIYRLDILLSSWLFHVQFSLLLPNLHTYFSRGRSHGLVCPSLSVCFPQFVVIHTVKGFGVLSKEEIDTFLGLFCSFDDPMDVGDLISGYSAFSEPA